MEKNINSETMNNIKNLIDNGNISEAISKISPEMIDNFSKMLNSNQNNSNNSESQHSTENNNTYNSNSSTQNFDFSKIDINTIMKMKSAMEKMNEKDDPRSNLLYSLKPYLRHTKQEKLDQYVNLLNFSKVAEILKNDKKDGNNV